MNINAHIFLIFVPSSLSVFVDLTRLLFPLFVLQCERLCPTILQVRQVLKRYGAIPEPMKGSTTRTGARWWIFLFFIGLTYFCRRVEISFLFSLTCFSNRVEMWFLMYLPYMCKAWLFNIFRIVFNTYKSLDSFRLCFVKSNLARFLTWLGLYV